LWPLVVFIPAGADMKHMMQRFTDLAANYDNASEDLIAEAELAYLDGANDAAIAQALMSIAYTARHLVGLLEIIAEQEVTRP
jgi:hypothetical protein